MAVNLKDNSGGIGCHKDGTAATFCVYFYAGGT
jgi:hypothetical protein